MTAILADILLILNGQTEKENDTPSRMDSLHQMAHPKGTETH
jgi:hypothetical protein